MWPSQRQPEKIAELKTPTEHGNLLSSRAEPSNDTLYLQSIRLHSHSLGSGGKLCSCHVDQQRAWVILRFCLKYPPHQRACNGLNPKPMDRHDPSIGSGARHHPKARPAGPQIVYFAAELGRRTSQHLGSQTPIFPRYPLLRDLYGNRSQCRSHGRNEWEFTLPVISIMRHKAAQGRGTLSPNQLHMYSVCLIQPLASGTEQSLNPGRGIGSSRLTPCSRPVPSHLSHPRPPLPRRPWEWASHQLWPGNE